MSHVILGTAGHIDHGKTALVRALTGVDTDRLKEEKARGITIELGFAELARDDGPSLGVVDVPGHEAFVRAMVAGAAGMDLVLLVVAADEGVMPQTREHLAVVELLGVPEMLVAVTKADLVEPEWMELVEEEIRELLQDGPYARAPIVPTSVVDRAGLDALRAELGRAADRADRRRADDLARLPADRVFTIQGTGTVVTGTLWSGTLRTGETVRLLPGGRTARVRGLQVHGRDVAEAEAGARTAVALTGEGADRDLLERGATLVTSEAWRESWMLTAEVRVLPDTAWGLVHNQRLHVHLGTQEVLARCAVLDQDLGPGDTGWVQLRLEAPVAARAGDRIVLRSYSPVTTLGGARVAEPAPPKRRRLDAATRRLLQAVLDGTTAEAIEAALTLSSWAGVDEMDLPVSAGRPTTDLTATLADGSGRGWIRVGQRLFSDAVARQADTLLLDALRTGHESDPLRARVPVATLRAALPDWAGSGLADARVAALAASGHLDIEEGGARAAGRSVTLTPDQAGAAEIALAAYRDAGLAPPDTAGLPDPVRARRDLLPLLHYLEAEGHLSGLGDGIWIDRAALRAAEAAVRRELAGREGLGPTDFREVLPVSRKHLMPILAHMDRVGVTLRRPDGRVVAGAPDPS